MYSEKDVVADVRCESGRLTTHSGWFLGKISSSASLGRPLNACPACFTGTRSRPQPELLSRIFLKLMIRLVIRGCEFLQLVINPWTLEMME